MKYLDRVRITSNKYEKYGIRKGDEGHILSAAIRDGRFDFWREDSISKGDNASSDVKIEHLELVSPANVSDDAILADLPKNDPKWWCKVEGGYILNLKGESKNKIPYDYNS